MRITRPTPARQLPALRGMHFAQRVMARHQPERSTQAPAQLVVPSPPAAAQPTRATVLVRERTSFLVVVRYVERQPRVSAFAVQAIVRFDAARGPLRGRDRTLVLQRSSLERRASLARFYTSEQPATRDRVRLVMSGRAGYLARAVRRARLAIGQPARPVGLAEHELRLRLEHAGVAAASSPAASSSVAAQPWQPGERTVLERTVSAAARSEPRWTRSNVIGRRTRPMGVVLELRRTMASDLRVLARGVTRVLERVERIATFERSVVRDVNRRGPLVHARPASAAVAPAVPTAIERDHGPSAGARLQTERRAASRAGAAAAKVALREAPAAARGALAELPAGEIRALADRVLEVIDKKIAIARDRRGR